MASSSAISETSSPPATEERPDNDLQAFFVLHRASARKTERKESKLGKTRRKIDLFQSSPTTHEKTAALPAEDDADQFYEQLRLQACNAAWSEMEGAIGESLRKINLNHFDEVHKWIFDSFAEIKSTGSYSVSRTLCPYPLVTDGICRQIFSALILTKNVEFVDNLSTFQELTMHLKSSGCHVAYLSSLDFTVKNGIASCLRSLLRQLVMVALDSHDIAVLASWYCESENYDKPVVVIIDDMEQCAASVLAEFISMISEWIIKIPIILVLGVATTIDAPRKLLPSDALRHLNSFKFTLASPSERLNVIVEAILAKPCLGFTIGHEVAMFLRNYFSRHDGTITSLIRALKIACTKHYSMEPLSFLSHFMHGEETENVWIQMCEAFPVTKLMYAFDLPSCQREKFSGRTSSNLAQGLSDFRRLWKHWTSVLLCLFEIGKPTKMRLIDIFCEAIDPTLYDVRALNNSSPSLVTDQKPCHAKSSRFAKGSLIGQAIQKVREFSLASLTPLLETWAKHTKEIDEIYNKVTELQSLLRSVDNEKTSKKQQSNIHRKLVPQCSSNLEEGALTINEKAAILMKEMIRDLLKPIECAPFHEIFCFKHVGTLRSALIGDTRRTIHLDLLKSPSYIQCCCCHNEDTMTSSMHDTSIMYHLAQEHGDFINLHDWYQSFKVIITSNKGTKRKVKNSSGLRKIDVNFFSSDMSEAPIQDTVEWVTSLPPAGAVGSAADLLSSCHEFNTHWGRVGTWAGRVLYLCFTHRATGVLIGGEDCKFWSPSFGELLQPLAI